jgi:hypothetical protein
MHLLEYVLKSEDRLSRSLLSVSHADPSKPPLDVILFYQAGGSLGFVAANSTSQSPHLSSLFVRSCWAQIDVFRRVNFLQKGDQCGRCWIARQGWVPGRYFACVGAVQAVAVEVLRWVSRVKGSRPRSRSPPFARLVNLGIGSDVLFGGYPKP